MPLRILHLIPSLQRCGTSKQLRLLATRLSPEDYCQQVCVLRENGPEARNLAQANIEVTCIQRRMNVDPVALLRLVKKIRQWKPDLVQTWSAEANSLGRIAATLAGCRHQIAIVDRILGSRTIGQRILDRLLTVRTDRIVANSHTVANSCLAAGIEQDQIAIIPNAIDGTCPSRWSRDEFLQEFDLPEDVLLIGSISELVPQKRVKELIWAADLVHLLNEKVQMLVIGDGPQRELLERFTRLIRAQGHVHFLGHRNDLPDILPHLDVLWQGGELESMPNIVLEAMCCGVPVVASDIPGHREIIQDGRNGYLAPVAGRTEYTRATDNLFDDAALTARITQAAQTSVLQNYFIDDTIKQYEQLYKSLLSKT